MHHAFSKINKDEGEAIGFGDFISIFLDKRQFFSRMLLEDAFAAIDINRNKMLDRDELKYFLNSLSKDEVDQLLSSFPPLEKGRISLEAFVSHVQQEVN
jgi:Ca2+-binding EF-hand superfamily protein